MPDATDPETPESFKFRRYFEVEGSLRHRGILALILKACSLNAGGLEPLGIVRAATDWPKTTAGTTLPDSDNVDWSLLYAISRITGTRVSRLSSKGVYGSEI